MRCVAATGFALQPGKPLGLQRQPAGLARYRSLRRELSCRPCQKMSPVNGTSSTVDADREQLVGRRLKDRPVVVHLDELAPPGGRASGR